MTFNWLHQHYGLAGLFGVMLGSGFGLYFLLASASYLYFFVCQRERYHPSYKPERAMLLRSVKWAFYSAAGNAALMVPVELLIIHGQSRIYLDRSDHSWAYLLLSAAMVLIIAETLIYWIHRFSHLPGPYRLLHSHHHQCREPTPFASIAFHPLDSFFQASPYHLCAFLFPLHIGVYLGFIMLVTIWAVAIHDRVRMAPTEWVNHTGCHMVHHWFFAHNYGQFFTVWDRLCGTYRSASCLPETFASSWPKNP